MKVILFFNNQRGFSILNSLVKRNVDVKFIFLSKKNLNTKVYKEVLKQNIPSLKVIKINSEKVKKIIKKIQPDLNIVAGFPYIINKKIYEIPKYGTVNLHAGKLPEYRGGSPLNWQIINGEKKIGISLIQLNQKLDAGKIICSKEFELKKDYDIKKVHELANKHFTLLTFEAINKLLKNKNFRKQNIKRAKYWKQRKESDGLLDFKNMSDKNVYNFVRAITEPYPCAFVKIKRKKLKIIKCKIYKKNLDIYPGQIFYDKKRIYLGCKKGIIEVIKHQYENS